MLELEAKILGVDVERVLAALAALGATPLLDSALTYMETFDFSCPDRYISEEALSVLGPEISASLASVSGKGLTLFEQGAYLRLRREGDSFECTLKQRVNSGTILPAIKTETEMSVAIGSEEWEDISDLLTRHGFIRIGIQEKRRSSFVLPPVRFDLDTWPGIPTYLEVEGPDIKSIESAITQIGYDPQRAVALGAAEVFQLYGISDSLCLRFDEMEGI